MTFLSPIFLGFGPDTLACQMHHFWQLTSNMCSFACYCRTICIFCWPLHWLMALFVFRKTFQRTAFVTFPTDRLSSTVVHVAAQNVENFDGYARIQGECPHFQGQFFWHWSASQCAARCNLYPWCSSFMWLGGPSRRLVALAIAVSVRWTRIILLKGPCQKCADRSSKPEIFRCGVATLKGNRSAIFWGLQQSFGFAEPLGTRALLKNHVWRIIVRKIHVQHGHGKYCMILITFRFSIFMISVTSRISLLSTRSPIIALRILFQTKKL